MFITISPHILSVCPTFFLELFGKILANFCAGVRRKMNKDGARIAGVGAALKWAMAKLATLEAILKWQNSLAPLDSTRIILPLLVNLE